MRAATLVLATHEEQRCRSNVNAFLHAALAEPPIHGVECRENGSRNRRLCTINRQ